MGLQPRTLIPDGLDSGLRRRRVMQDAGKKQKWGN